MVDFGKRHGKGRRETTLDPCALYEGLDRAVDVGPLRPAQAAVLQEWHEKRRQDCDLILKLHTGQGKTLVGLLMLQSRLNEGLGPALYLCPNRYLVAQTCAQAQRFGIQTCTAEGDLPQEFIDGRSILVATVWKLFNGLTKFGLGRQAQPVNSIVVDDAHASVDDIRASFRIRLPNTKGAYADLLALFQDALRRQGPGSLSDIEAQDYHAFLCVPYWEWHSRQEEVVRILAAHKEDDCLKFQWSLLKDGLDQCHCAVSGTTFEIEPYLPPLDLFGSFAKAKHRVFMSATTADDSFLLKGLRLPSAAIRNPLVYRDERWSGEKMVLLPSLVDAALDRSAIVNWLGNPMPKRTFGVVVLVPSERRTKDWNACGSSVATTESLDREIKRLVQGDCAAALVLMNRYDGIDLPDKMCRILILDSRPFSDALIDRYADQCRASSEITALRIAKKIEQGLGRSVRGEKDFSAIILIGDDLVRTVRSEATRRHLSQQTRSQIDIGIEIAEMAKAEITEGAEPQVALRDLINQCLRRDQDWKAFYAERMDAVTVGPTPPSALEVLEQELQAEVEFQAGRLETAVGVLQKLVDDRVRDDQERGWYLQEMARYQWTSSRVDSERMQTAAHAKNHDLLRPRSGSVFVKLTAVSEKRIANIVSWLQQHGGYQEVKLHVDEILDDLALGVPANRFERAVEDLGKALGFGSQRPEKQFKEGPDNLWALRQGEYVVIECKNNVGETRAEISKSEAAQMDVSAAWFADSYPGAKAGYLMFHPAGKCGIGAHFTTEVRVCRKAGLKDFRNAVAAFFTEFKGKDIKDLSETRVQVALIAHGLQTDGLIERFSRLAA